MSKSIQRNYRRRDDDSDDECLDSKTNQPINKQHYESTSILSFGDELDEIEVFKKKTSSIKKDTKPREHKRKHRKQTSPKRESPIELHVQESFKVKEPYTETISESFEDPIENNVTSLIKKGDIPNAGAIDMLKKQRELAAKKSAMAQEVIPSEEIRTMSLNFEIDSGLVRRETIGKNVKRIDMIGEIDDREGERQRYRANFLSVEHDLAFDSDQENEWENRQMSHAINKNVVSNTKESTKNYWQQNNVEYEPEPDSMILNELNNIELDQLTVPKFKELLQKRKEEIIKRKRKVKEEIEEKKELVIQKQNQAKNAEMDIPILELKYNTFNNFKRFILMLSNYFDEKMPNIVYLEKKFLKFYRERAQKLSKRIRQDVKDQFDEIVLSTKSSVVQSTYEVTARATRIADKESRMLRRARARENVGTIGHFEGLSSDDEEPKSTISSRQNEIDQIKVEADRLFEDAECDCQNINIILDRFIQVHEKFEVDYADAYINGFIAHILGPLVRLELITWNPLMVPRFDKWNWFKILIEFTKNHIGSEIITDRTSVEFGYLKMIPVIFERIVIPKIIEWIPVWNPMLSSETKNLVSIIGKLINQIPTVNDKSPHIRNMLCSIACRINDCIAEDIAIPLSVQQYKENPSGPAFQFFLRQMWSVIKTFCNIMLLNEILETKLLCKLALDGIMNNYIITGLNILLEMEMTGIIVAMIHRIKHSFPLMWFSTSSISSESNSSNTTTNSKFPDISQETGSIIRFAIKFANSNRKEKAVTECVYSLLEYFNIPKSELNQQSSRN